MMLARKNTRRLDLSVFAILDFVTNMFSSLINVLIFVRKSGTHIGCSGWSGSSGSPDDPLGRSTTGWWSNQEVFPKDLVSGSEHLELDVLLWSAETRGKAKASVNRLSSGSYFCQDTTIQQIAVFSVATKPTISRQQLAYFWKVRYSKSKWC